MFNKDVFKNNIQKIQTEMKTSFRGEIDSKIESRVIDELSKIFLTVADNFATLAEKGFPSQPALAIYPQEQRAFYALQDLIERMELDFTQKFVMNVKHDLEKEIEIGKIQISFLDSVRRNLNGSKVQ
ncbi:hypothetical protein [Bdellovibrio sp. GT3]|uniref:hypothetical protein n=1 Tax=Bdellovibrio sp. GT3 TaxID=3136282 RepID=UPI0030F092F7